MMILNQIDAQMNLFKLFFCFYYRKKIQKFDQLFDTKNSKLESSEVNEERNMIISNKLREGLRGCI